MEKQKLTPEIIKKARELSEFCENNYAKHGISLDDSIKFLAKKLGMSEIAVGCAITLGTFYDFKGLELNQTKTSY